MRRHLLYMAMSGLLAGGLSACQQDAPGMEPLDEEARRIYLSAGVGDAVSSRTPYHPGGSEPTVSHPLNVSVWASTTSGVFDNGGKNGSDGTVAIHTDAHFQSGDPQLLGEAIYPKAQTQGGTAKEVYVVGLHPLSDSTNSWSATNGNKNAQFTFTGKEDVMFAPQISGTYGTAYEQSPEFHFYHLLTWLRIEMVADKDETDVRNREKVRDAWGKIKELTITSKNQVTIHNIGTTGYKEVDGTPTIDRNEFTNEGNVSFSNETSLNLYCHNTDDQFPITGRDNDNTVPNEFKGVIPTSVTPVAYVMCAPVQGIIKDALENPVPEYTLHIKTEHREMDIPLDLEGDGTDGTLFAENTMGRMFTIVLNFKMGDVISVSTEISVGGDADWFTHGTGSGDLKEDDLQ